MDNRHDTVKLALYERFLKDAGALPSMPEASLRLRQLLTGDAPSHEQASALLETYPSLAERLMEFASLPLLGHIQPGARLLDVVRQLDGKRLSNLVLAFELHQLFDGKEPSLRKVFNKRWHLNLQRAAVSAGLAQHLPHLEEEDALLAGLLQDIGSLPLLEELHRWPQVSRLEVDLQRLCEQLSAEVGVLLLIAWKLPASLQDCARLRRDWCRQHKGAVDLADVVQVASQLLEEPRNDDRLARLPAYQRMDLPTPQVLRAELAEVVALWLKLLGGRPPEAD
ncbi:HDOD domain-containing protein [Pseudomonas sp. JS3066]|jgi:HD-like signal output (HDOD) protein|uniref:HDOD domain-containing protein n=1 Tax=unclassified Pseudomonas TaxID=196821 RepID=UPI000EA9D192|nr:MULTISPECIES: HDOD domain-containing protein [unclassified Pseudomonas]AYF87935.1 HDOD domain-containing protein [Pseudomonas sp. DY-1]MDH4655721.1 HDOD domain-containing protein [Pseudomonas sp. BN606]MRK23957.1 HDOD domain-containing protein [Pseudomonas sp. JG-B]WVK94497.1 HDOD domain-containing protein [Pseudomonas sp. JS3066]